MPKHGDTGIVVRTRDCEVWRTTGYWGRIVYGPDLGCSATHRNGRGDPIGMIPTLKIFGWDAGVWRGRLFTSR